jgi:hypothetical protein
LFTEICVRLRGAGANIGRAATCADGRVRTRSTIDRSRGAAIIVRGHAATCQHQTRTKFRVGFGNTSVGIIGSSVRRILRGITFFDWSERISRQTKSGTAKSAAHLSAALTFGTISVRSALRVCTTRDGTQTDEQRQQKEKSHHVIAASTPSVLIRIAKEDSSVRDNHQVAKPPTTNAPPTETRSTGRTANASPDVNGVALLFNF